MIRKYLVLLVMLGMPFLGFGQFTLSGKITDMESKQPLPGTTLVLLKTFMGATSDFDGNYGIQNLGAGDYEVKVSRIGYKEVLMKINLATSMTKDFEMERSAVMEDEFTVIATRVNDKSGMAVTNLSKSDIERDDVGQDVPYLLKLTPSVVETSDAGTGIGYTYLRIRGSDATRINVTINGIPVNDAEDHSAYWVDMPDVISSVDNIQIQRGVGTSTNGAGAFGATINMQTTALDTLAHAQQSTTYGSFDTWRNTLSFGTGLINERWNFEGRLSDISSNGYIDRGTSKLQSFFASGGYYGKKSVLKFNVSSGYEKTYQAWNGVPQDSLATHRTYNVYSYQNETDNYWMDNYQLLYSTQINTHWNINAALHYTHGYGYYEQYVNAQDPYDPANPSADAGNFSAYGLNDVIIGTDTITGTNLIRQLWLDNKFYGTTFSINYNSNKKFNFTLGGAANRYNGDHYTQIVWAQYASNSDNQTKYDYNNAVKKDANIYAKVNYELSKKLYLFGDVQCRTLDYTFLGYDMNSMPLPQTISLNFFNPKAGLNYDFSNDKRIYASYCVGNREPVREDFIQSTPQSRPKPEHLDDIEIGYKQQTKWFSFGVNIYYMNYKDQLVLTGKIDDVGDYIHQNINKSYRQGIELEASIKVSKDLDIAMNATFSKNKIMDYVEYVDNYDSTSQRINNYSSTDIAFSPNLTGSGMISWHPIKNFDVSLIDKYVGKQYLDNSSNEYRIIKAYNINDFKLRYSFKLSPLKEVGISFIVNNLLNVYYESNGWTYTYISGGEIATQNNYYPQATRNYLGSVTLKF